jgi:hypothetical protein
MVPSSQLYNHRRRRGCKSRKPAAARAESSRSSQVLLPKSSCPLTALIQFRADTADRLSQQKPCSPPQTSPSPSSQSDSHIEYKLFETSPSSLSRTLISQRFTTTTSIHCRLCCLTMQRQYPPSRTRYGSQQCSQTWSRRTRIQSPPWLVDSWSAGGISTLLKLHDFWMSICALELARD